MIQEDEALMIPVGKLGHDNVMHLKKEEENLAIFFQNSVNR